MKALIILACLVIFGLGDDLQRYQYLPPVGKVQDGVALINYMRHKPCKCGYKKYGVRLSLKWNETLADAALVQAKDMATVGKLSHTGSDKSSVLRRVRKLGYKEAVVGENIAYNQQTLLTAVEDWMASVPHCENIKDGDYKEMGLALWKTSDGATYWALVLAKPERKSNHK
jgi:uncharacterized protein YkwD